MGLPAPYYQDADCTLYLGDCRDVLPRLERASVDLLLTDPPYGINFVSRRRAELFPPIAGDDGSLPVLDCLRLALRALRNDRHVYIFGRFDLASLPLASPVELIWDQQGSAALGDMALPWGLTHEPCTFAVHVESSANRERGDGRLAARLRKGSVLRVPRLNSRANTNHPTEKPAALLRQMIESSTLLGETVLDPFAGSGSTGVAAKLEGRRSVLIELEERYCEIAARRLAQQVLPLEVAS